jgi:hypothetical protein
MVPEPPRAHTAGSHSSWEAEPDLRIQLAMQSRSRDQLADRMSECLSACYNAQLVGLKVQQPPRSTLASQETSPQV